MSDKYRFSALGVFRIAVNDKCRDLNFDLKELDSLTENCLKVKRLDSISRIKKDIELLQFYVKHLQYEIEDTK